MSGIAYNAPLEDLAIFDPSVFLYGDTPLTQAAALTNFLQFPTAQGTENFGDLTSSGTATLTNIDVTGSATFQTSITMVGGGISTAPIVVADVFPAPTQTTTISSSQLSFIDSATTNIASLDDTQLVMASTTTLNSVDIKNVGITLTDSGGTNILDADAWSGNIASVNTGANLTHYLGFFDSSTTGSGKPQKNASLSCNPSTGTITATTFSGSISNATGVSLTSDDTAGSYFLPFSKTTAATANSLFIDNTTTPLTYNPNTSTLTASVFSGSATTVAITDDNTATTYYPTFVAAVGNAQTLRIDSVTGPMSYDPSVSRLTVTTMRSDFIAPSSSSATPAIYTGLSTGSLTIMPTQSTGSVTIGNAAATTGLCNVRPPLVLSRQLQTTNSTTYPPNVATHLGYAVQTLGSAFTTTSLLSSTNTDLMSYAFTSANYGTYLFNAIVALSPNDNLASRQLILAISQTSATVINTPFVDLQYSMATVGYPYLQVQGVYQIYSGSPTIYLVGYCLGSAAAVQTSSSTSHFSYTRIA